MHALSKGLPKHAHDLNIVVQILINVYFQGQPFESELRHMSAFQISDVEVLFFILLQQV